MQVLEFALKAAGVKFFQKAEVVDPDDASNVYVFDVDDSTHCACFNIGEQLTWPRHKQPLFRSCQLVPFLIMLFMLDFSDGKFDTSCHSSSLCYKKMCQI